MVRSVSLGRWALLGGLCTSAAIASQGANLSAAATASVSRQTTYPTSHQKNYQKSAQNALITQANGPFSPQVSIEEKDGYRYITANGIPNHAVGQFPNSGNPNTLSEQSHSFRVTLTPALSGEITRARLIFGVALNGVPFEPGTAEFWRRDRSAGWNYEALTGHLDLGTDQHNAHVQPSGSYHYHGLPTGLILQTSEMTLLGYAADGFPIYGPYGYVDANDASSGVTALRSSYQLKPGQRPSGADSPGGRYDGAFHQDFEYVDGLGDLDECNGRVGVTPDYPQGIYHYYITETFPFVSRCLKGTPDESFMRSRPPAGAGGSERPGGRPGNSRRSGSERGMHRHPGNRPHRPSHAEDGDRPRPPRHPRYRTDHSSEQSYRHPAIEPTEIEQLPSFQQPDE